jgi:hypothetical protein
MYSILSYNGILITAAHIEADIMKSMPELAITESLPA